MTRPTDLLEGVIRAEPAAREKFLDTFYPRLRRRSDRFLWYLDVEATLRRFFLHLLDDDCRALRTILREEGPELSASTLETRLWDELCRTAPDLDEILERCRRELLRRARRRYPHLEPEDLVQETFRYLFEDEERIRRAIREGGGSLDDPRCLDKLWNALCGIAANWRRAVVRKNGTINVPPEEQDRRPGADADPELSAEARELLLQLDRCVREHSTSREFLVWRLSFVYGFKPSEIAAMVPAEEAAASDAAPSAAERARRAGGIYRMKERLKRIIERCRERLGL